VASSTVTQFRCALYARVSTFNGQDPELQLRELREFALHRGWEIAGEYVDQGVSGSKESRPQLNQLMADARKRRFDVIAVWKLDRFGRSLKHLVMTLADLESLGIAFVSLRDSFDLSTPSGRLLFQLVGAMAEFERALIQERVRAGLKNAKAKGRKLGRPRIAIPRDQIESLRQEGLSWEAIAKELGAGVGTVYRAYQAAGAA